MNTIIGLLDTDIRDKDEKSIVNPFITICDHMFHLEYEKIVQRITTDIWLSEHNEPTKYQAKAIWDTGAITSVISEKLAKTMKLKPINNGIAVTPSGQIEMPIYMLDIQLSDEFVIKNVKIGGLPLEKHDASFLLGMDVISKGNLSIENSGGKTKVTFKY